MTERLPYEEQLAQQWGDLPLPDENMAWADMKRRLDEDDDDGLIPVWLRGCALWGMIGILLLGLGWWILRPEKWFDQKKTIPQKEIVKETPVKQKQKDEPSPTKPENKTGSSETISASKTGQTNDRPDEQKEKLISQDRSFSKLTGKKKKVITVREETDEKKTGSNKPSAVKEIVVTKNRQENKVLADPAKQDSLAQQKKIIANDQPEPGKPNDDIRYTATDTIAKKTPDSLQQNKEPGVTKLPEPKKDSTKKSSVWFSAGIAVNQQLPVSGQKLTPYNAEGRKGSIADYLPSAYFRMYKNDKWFIQSEFRYGAPQYNKEILYYQKVQSDTFNLTKTTTSLDLKKTFYHQLPVSFNYFITKDWSVGGGVVWNKFVAAISSEDIVRHYNQSGVDSFLVKGKIISTKDSNSLAGLDSNFAKTYFQGIFETQYRWKRFSFGLRYAFGLEPYLQFKLPGGVQQREKNNSLNIFIRYELWRSKKD